MEIGLPFDNFRLSAIAKFLQLEVQEVIERYYGHVTDEGELFIGEDAKRTPCPFLDKDGGELKCAIYKVRPEGCRAYPLDTDCGTQDVDCPAEREVFRQLYNE